VRAVETHRHNVKRKLNLNGHPELVRYAIAHSRDLDVTPPTAQLSGPASGMDRPVRVP